MNEFSVTADLIAVMFWALCFLALLAAGVAIIPADWCRRLFKNHFHESHAVQNMTATQARKSVKDYWRSWGEERYPQ